MNEHERNHPKNNSSIFSKLFFHWTFDIFKIGSKRNIEIADLYTVLHEHKSELIHQNILNAWNKERKKNKPSLFCAVYKCFQLQIIFTIFLAFLRECLVRPLQAVFLGRLISIYQIDYQKNDEIYFYVFGILICSLITVLLSHPCAMMVSHLGLKYRVALTSLITEKALKLSLCSLDKTTVGQVINLLSNDLRRFDMGTVLLNYLIVSPIQMIIISYFLWVETKTASLFGITIFLMIIPLQYWVGKQISLIRSQAAILTDKRLALITEIINAIQQIKMFVWEEAFIDKINLIRKQEINKMKQLSYLKGLVSSSSMFITRLALFFILICYTLQNHQITATKVFVTVCFYEILKQTMVVWFLSAINQLVELFVTFERIQSFLLLREKENQEKWSDTNDDDLNYLSIKLDKVTVIKNENKNHPCLKNISLEINKNSFAILTGEVGSGKTSLLQVLTGEVVPKSGSILVNGRISYASQDPCLFEGTIKENIVFHNKFDENRYLQIIEYCHLDYDFSNFPDSDSTIINANSSPLSGGQKARIHLARCLYHEADIYLFDNPLAAVDENVGKQIYQKVFQRFLKSKTIILVTNNLQCLDGTENIIVLKEGELCTDDKWIKKSQKDAFIDDQCSRNDMFQHKKNEKILNTKSKQNRSNRAVTYKTYLHYYRAGNSLFLIIILIIIFIITQAFVSGSDYWLKVWTEFEEKNTASLDNSTMNLKSNFSSILFNRTDIYSKKYYSFYYMTLILLLTIMLIGRSFLFYKMSMKASLGLHKTMLTKLINSKMWVFNMNSSGEILNRFSQDIGMIDDLLPLVSLDSYQIILAILGIFCVIILTNGWFMLCIFGIVCYLLYILRNYYLKTARNLTRLESQVRSPVFSHLSSILQSLITIRSMNAESFMAQKMHIFQNIYSTVSYLSIGTSRAFALWLDLICIFLIAAVSLYFPLFQNDTSPGNVGLAITQIIGLMTILQWGIRQTSVMENQMTSIERVTQYNNNIQEENIHNLTSFTIVQIEFINVSFRYHPDNINILNNVSFEVQKNEKIIIMGRTGSGKSSLINALLKFGHIDGAININGTSIHSINSHDLRSMISIVPQEPALFSGTIRENLDPLYKLSDDEIWRALEQVQLKSVILTMPHQLQETVINKGSNFSVGEKQLLCLARAIIQKNKVLILDEATSMIDAKTDSLIQLVLRENFANSIIMIIAHRIQYLNMFDKVLIVDSGELVEFDKPELLLKNKNSLLSKLYKEYNR